MKLYKTPTNEVMLVEHGQEFLVQQDWSLMTDEEVELFKNPPKTQEDILQEFTFIKNQAVADMLKKYRYDSLATVKLWADDATYGAEATQILNWYKAVTAMSIQLDNDVVAGAVPMPTEEEYKVLIDSVVL